MAIYAASLLGEIALTWVGFQGEPASACRVLTLLDCPVSPSAANVWQRWHAVQQPQLVVSSCFL